MKEPMSAARSSTGGLDMDGPPNTINGVEDSGGRPLLLETQGKTLHAPVITTNSSLPLVVQSEHILKMEI